MVLRGEDSPSIGAFAEIFGIDVVGIMKNSSMAEEIVLALIGVGGFSLGDAGAEDSIGSRDGGTRRRPARREKILRASLLSASLCSWHCLYGRFWTTTSRGGRGSIQARFFRLDISKLKRLTLKKKQKTPDRFEVSRAI